MITLEEKIKLAEEAGANQVVENLKKELAEKKVEEEMRKEVEELSAMKFKVTTVEKIKAMICHKYWHAPENGDHVFFLFFFLNVLGSVALAGILRLIDDFFYHGSMPNKIIAGIMATYNLCAIAALFLELCRTQAKMEACALSFWSHPIPAGALLAVKEAKKRGLSHFEIYYPVTERRARLLADPVIVGYRKIVQSPMGRTKGIGPMIEVFAWDDGQVYE